MILSLVVFAIGRWLSPAGPGYCSAPVGTSLEASGEHPILVLFTYHLAIKSCRLLNRSGDCSAHWKGNAVA